MNEERDVKRTEERERQRQKGGREIDKKRENPLIYSILIFKRERDRERKRDIEKFIVGKHILNFLKRNEQSEKRDFKRN